MLRTITARVDTRLSEYMFERVLRLPIDFFERTPVGQIAHDMNEIFKIRDFLTGQLFGTILDSMTLFVFLPVMFFFSPMLTFVVLALCGLIVLWLVYMLPAYSQGGRRGDPGGDRPRNAALPDARGHADDQVVVARTQANGPVGRVDARRSRTRGCTKATSPPSSRRSSARSTASPVNGSFALGVYIAITTQRPRLHRRAVRLPDADPARIRAADADGAARQSSTTRPAPRWRSSASSSTSRARRTHGHGVRSPLRGHVAVLEVAVQIRRRRPACARRRDVRSAAWARRSASWAAAARARRR